MINKNKILYDLVVSQFMTLTHEFGLPMECEQLTCLYVNFHICDMIFNNLTTTNYIVKHLNMFIRRRYFIQTHGIESMPY